MKSIVNPWFDNNIAQKEWFKQWSKEEQNCKSCLDGKCTVADRMNKDICKNLHDRGLKQ